MCTMNRAATCVALAHGGLAALAAAMDMLLIRSSLSFRPRLLVGRHPWDYAGRGLLHVTSLTHLTSRAVVTFLAACQ